MVDGKETYFWDLGTKWVHSKLEGGIIQKWTVNFKTMELKFNIIFFPIKWGKLFWNQTLG